ncbi:MAG: carboxymuconolactone decarboxylase family protein [Marmoricola sp.]
MSPELFTLFPRGYRALGALEAALAESDVPPSTRELVKMRSSQLNGCAYCLDMHYQDARAAGETEQRLALLAAWRETELYTDAERAALALTEAVTLISQAHVPAAVEAEARHQFGDATYAALVFAIVAINAWNRLAITGHAEPGHYTPAAHG